MYNNIDGFGLRKLVYYQMAQWAKEGKWVHPDGREGGTKVTYCQKHLSELFDDPDILLTGIMTHEQAELCKQLAGPHGYALYRMLLVKRGL